MKFFNELIDMNSSKNSKIFLGLIFAFLTIVLIVSKAYFINFDIELIYLTGGIMTTLLGLGIVTPNNTKPE